MEDLALSNFQVLSGVVCEFLEVAFNCILYTRHIYPSGIFSRHRKYNIPIQICDHPSVKKYITDTISGVKLLLETGDVDLIVLAIFDSANEPLERFVFEIVNSSQNSESDQLLLHLEEHLRAFILKINLSGALLKHLPKACSWAVQLHTKRSTLPRATSQHQQLQDFPWVEADDREVHMDQPSLLPLKSMTSDGLQMQLFVEESGQKK